MISVDTATTNSLAQCGEYPYAWGAREAARPNPICPLGCPTGCIQYYATDREHGHQFGNGQKPGRIDVRNWQQVNDDVPEAWAGLVDGSDELPFEIGSVEEGDRGVKTKE